MTANSGLLRMESMWREAMCEEATCEGVRWATAGGGEAALAGDFSGELTGCSRSRWARNDEVSRVSSCWLSRGVSGSWGWILEASALKARGGGGCCWGGVAWLVGDWGVVLGWCGAAVVLYGSGGGGGCD